MAVTIKPISGSVRLRVTGDIETVLTVPYDDDDRFLVGFSDGTLLLGIFDKDLRCRWDVAREGASLVSFVGEGVELKGQARWVTASAFDPNVVEPQKPQALPLFPDLDRWAA